MGHMLRQPIKVGTKIVVYHTHYGCETGCCGHAIALAEGFDGEYGLPADDGDVLGSFQFDHPYAPTDEDRLAMAKRIITQELGEEHVVDLDWEHCFWVESCDMA